MKLFTRYCSFTVTPIYFPLILVRREWITVSRRDITTSIGGDPLAIDSGGSIPGTLPLIRFDPTCVMAPKTLITSAPTSVTLVTPVPMAFVLSATFSPTQLGSPTRPKAPLKLSPVHSLGLPNPQTPLCAHFQFCSRGILTIQRC